MSCGVAIGLALADLAIFVIATNATALAVGGAVAAANRAAERRRLREMMLEATAGELNLDEVLDEDRAEGLRSMIDEAGLTAQFQGTDVIVRTGTGDVIGLKRDSEGIYQVVAKWCPDDAQRLQVDTSEVAEKWRQRYAYLKVKKEAEALGYQVVEEEVLADDSVRVRVRRWD
ncbi:MAG: DUF1257 domain-containing protein [Armatimonadota bacterium]|nr:DUF1257 domain-containing protein [Armatimonadota bacterium]